jgi:hypothetical protein
VFSGVVSFVDFASIGIAAEASGPSVVLAIAVATVVATCNELSSAHLAAYHSASGGTADWMFLCVKSASTTTAALGVSGYLLHALGQADNESNAGGQGGGYRSGRLSCDRLGDGVRPRRYRDRRDRSFF